MIKKLAQDLFPPLLWRTLKGVRRSSNIEVFDTYEQAAQACVGFGYEEEELVEVVFQKTKNYRDQIAAQSPLEVGGSDIQTLLGVTLALEANQGNQLRVIDFGGACGAHYFMVKQFFTTSRICWHVVETPAMAYRAKELENEELKFFDNLALAKEGFDELDLVYSSGTLQYVPEPSGTLEKLVDCRAKFLLLNRLGVSLGTQDVITVQKSKLSANGPGPLPVEIQDNISLYPCQFISKQKLDVIIQKKYNICLQFDDKSGMFKVRSEPIIGLAYFCKRI